MASEHGRPPTGFPAGAFLIGAQKSATTSFADMLAQHPAIVLSTPKEPHFFTFNRDRGLDWYAERFAGPRDGRVLLDASTSYSDCPLPGEDVDAANDPRVGVPERIRSLRPDARFIYLVRDPVERAYSAYWHMVRRGFEHRPLREAIQARSLYIATSSYAYQLSRYWSLFSPSQFLIVETAAFRRDPTSVMAECLRFMGLSPDNMKITDLRERNRSFTYNGAGRMVLRLVGGEAGLKRIGRWGRRVLPRQTWEQAAAMLTDPIPPLDDRDRAYIRSCLEPNLVDMASLSPLHIIK